jgi:mRNA-degrading endonuclease RelE of RelBE toxin-antitoxin system
MIRVTTHDDFLKSAAKLPVAQQRKLALLITYVQVDPFDIRLHTKHLSGTFTGLLSLRITRDWRVILRFLDSQTVMLVDVAHRKDIYR